MAPTSPNAERIAIPAPLRKVLSTREAAERCGVSTETIRRWIKHKGLPAYNTELGLKIRIRLDDLQAFAAQHNIWLTPEGAYDAAAEDEVPEKHSSPSVSGQLTVDL
jgi:excisionase family DNA binding protein